MLYSGKSIEELLDDSKYQQQPMMSGVGPGMEKTIPPPQNGELYRYLASKNETPPVAESVKPSIPLEEFPFYSSPEGTRLAQDTSNKTELLANLGQAGQTMARGLTGFDSGDFYDKMRSSAQQPITQENIRQSNVRDYLKNKYEGGLKKKSYELQLAELQNKNRHEGVMEDLAKRELGIKELKDSPNAPLQNRVLRLSAEEKKNVANQTEAIQALHEMNDALVKGQNTVSLIGDNDYTLAARKFSEALGRLQSGGAIGKEEIKTFKSFLPSPTDSKEIQRKKLEQGITQMTNRLKMNGFTPEDFGVSSVLKEEKGVITAQSSPNEIPPGMKLQKNLKTGETRLVPK